jgi:hypothetical protein
MQFREIFKITRGTKVILAITSSVCAVAIVFAFFYYHSINRSFDPRVKKAGEYLQRFERLSVQVDGIDAFPLLDSAFAIFRSLPDYESSYELGVIYNNKCSSLLIKALYDSTISDAERNLLLRLSKIYCDSSISVYSAWISKWENLPAETIASKVRIFLREDDPAFAGYNFNRIKGRRVKDLEMAQVETPRRLSVSYTNLAAIFRHMNMPDSSLYCYNEALALWKDNRTAKSNLNVLMGGDPIKPGIIESLFPPDRRKR